MKNEDQTFMNKHGILENFIESTKTDLETAIKFLDLTLWNLNEAVNRRLDSNPIQKKRLFKIYVINSVQPTPSNFIKELILNNNIIKPFLGGFDFNCYLENTIEAKFLMNKFGLNLNSFISKIKF
jgi:hypothetical protein